MAGLFGGGKSEAPKPPPPVKMPVPKTQGENQVDALKRKQATAGMLNRAGTVLGLGTPRPSSG